MEGRICMASEKKSGQGRIGQGRSGQSRAGQGRAELSMFVDMMSPFPKSLQGALSSRQMLRLVCIPYPPGTLICICVIASFEEKTKCSGLHRFVIQPVLRLLIARWFTWKTC